MTILRALGILFLIDICWDLIIWERLEDSVPDIEVELAVYSWSN